MTPAKQGGLDLHQFGNHLIKKEEGGWILCDEKMQRSQATPEKNFMITWLNKKKIINTKCLISNCWEDWERGFGGQVQYYLIAIPTSTTSYQFTLPIAENQGHRCIYSWVNNYSLAAIFVPGWLREAVSNTVYDQIEVLTSSKPKIPQLLLAK